MFDYTHKKILKKSPTKTNYVRDVKVINCVKKKKVIYDFKVIILFIIIQFYFSFFL